MRFIGLRNRRDELSKPRVCPKPSRSEQSIVKQPSTEPQTRKVFRSCKRVRLRREGSDGKRASSAIRIADVQRLLFVLLSSAFLVWANFSRSRSSSCWRARRSKRAAHEALVTATPTLTPATVQLPSHTTKVSKLWAETMPSCGTNGGAVGPDLQAEEELSRIEWIWLRRKKEPLKDRQESSLTKNKKKRTPYQTSLAS